MNQYFNEKSKMYYEMYLQNKYVRKVSAIIKVGDRFLVLVKDGKVANTIGGTVENGETTKHAIIREVLEETGIKIVNPKYLTKIYYSRNWNYNNIEFKNKRIEFYYYCELDKVSGEVKGINGEFSKDVSLKLCSLKDLEQLNLSKRELKIIDDLKKNIKF